MQQRHTSLCKPRNRICPIGCSRVQREVNKSGRRTEERNPFSRSVLSRIMSGRDSLGRGTPAVAKLKEGLQDAIVFLQTLASFKIPAVMERRRKELLDKLLLLQGGTVKETPPKFGESDPEPEPVADSKKPAADKPKEAEHPTKDKAESSENSSAASSTVTSPYHGKPIKRRDSTNVLSKIKDYESIHHTAKKEEESETPKNRLVTLKRVSKPADFPASADKDAEEEKNKEESDKEKSIKEEDEKTAANGSAAEEKGEVSVTLDVVDGSRERASSIISGEESNDEEEEGDKKKKKKTKKSGGFGLGSKVKGFMKREKSPLPQRKNGSPAADGSLPPEADKEEPDQDRQQEEPAEEVEEAEEVPEEEEGVRISGDLGRLKNKKMGLGKSAKQVHVKVMETSLMLGKEELDLAKSSVELTDIGFDLTHPQHKSTLMFKVEGDEEKRQKWVDALKEAIDKATPPEEEKPEAEETAPAVNESVPSITVEDTGSMSASKKGKRESKALTVKPEKKLPDQGVTMKGNFLRKKPGISRSWEKTYCVLTYQAFYFSGEADTKDYSNMLPIYPNMDAKLECKKGKGDSPGLCLKLGKKQELFSFESQADCQSWKNAIENVLGLGGVEELLSEDEEDGGGNAGPEELYEELGLDDLPPVPASPRPSRPNIPAPAVPSGAQDDFAIDEDIYEETDDILPTMPNQSSSYHQSPQHVPSLPNRNPPKAPAASTPGPSLPPRNAPAPAPSLPPRSAGGKSKPPLAAPPMDYEETNAVPPKIGAKPAAKAPAPAPIADEDQELYDDVVVDAPIGGGGGGADADEEMYDDVVVGGGGDNQDEELYDDVMTTSGLPTGGVGGGNAAAAPATNKPPAEPITEEFYEDMAPGAVTDPYVALEKNKEEELDDGDELYVDVDEPAAAPVQRLQSSLTPQARSASPKLFGASKKGKKGSISSPSGTLSRGLVNGNIGYKAPKKSKFDEKWGCVEGTSLLVFKSSGDKKHQDKIPLGDCRLDIGSTEAGAGKFAFSLSKGDKYYHFSLRTQVDVDKWVDVLKGIVKYAPVEAAGNGAEGEFEVFQAREDHIADSNDELTFKKGTIIKLIERKSKDMWYGQIGNEAQVFEGKKGNFPANKVEIAEDLYI